MQKISTPFGHEQDHYYMERALTCAHKAYEQDEVPIGAVVVDNNGVIIGRGYNRVEQLSSQNAHAEIRALVAATKKRNDWRLDGCWLYVTLEPCTMCMGLIALSRLEGVVFGAASPLFGYRLDKDADIWLYKKDAVQSIEGVCALQSTEILKKFFKKQRNRRG